MVIGSRATDVTHLANIFICGPPPLCKLVLSDTDHRYIDQVAINEQRLASRSDN